MARKKIIEDYFVFSQELHRKDYYSIIIWVAPEPTVDGTFDKQYKRYSISYTTSLPMLKFDEETDVEQLCKSEFSSFHGKSIAKLLNIQKLVPQHALENIQNKVGNFIKTCYYDHVE